MCVCVHVSVCSMCVCVVRCLLSGTHVFCITELKSSMLHKACSSVPGIVKVFG